jgi:NADH-quinone oxidoreductase subunit J
MSDTLFYVFAALTLGFAALVVFKKNAVASALCFFMSLCGVAGLFVMLDAFLLAALLVLVYAGAVVALFLFIIMLLDMQGGERKPFKKLTIFASLMAAALLGLGVLSFIQHTHGAGSTALAAAQQAVPFFTELKIYGAKLFTTYMLPVQVVGFLLLIAMLGVIVLSKRFEGLEDVK